jgi:hypothetical protein
MFVLWSLFSIRLLFRADAAESGMHFGFGDY